MFSLRGEKEDGEAATATTTTATEATSTTVATSSGAAAQATESGAAKGADGNNAEGAIDTDAMYDAVMAELGGDILEDDESEEGAAAPEQASGAEAEEGVFVDELEDIDDFLDDFLNGED